MKGLSLRTETWRLVGVGNTQNSIFPLPIIKLQAIRWKSGEKEFVFACVYVMYGCVCALLSSRNEENWLWMGSASHLSSPIDQDHEWGWGLYCVYPVLCMPGPSLAPKLEAQRTPSSLYDASLWMWMEFQRRERMHRGVEGEFRILLISTHPIHSSHSY